MAVLTVMAVNDTRAFLPTLFRNMKHRIRVEGSFQRVEHYSGDASLWPLSPVVRRKYPRIEYETFEKSARILSKSRALVRRCLTPSAQPRSPSKVVLGSLI